MTNVMIVLELRLTLKRMITLTAMMCDTALLVGVMRRYEVL